MRVFEQVQDKSHTDSHTEQTQLNYLTTLAEIN